MSDVFPKLVDRHLDRLPGNTKWYLLIGLVVIVILFGNAKQNNIPSMDLTEYHHVNFPPVAENVGSGSSGNNVSGVVLQ